MSQNRAENSLEIINFGCRLNAYEGEIMRANATEAKAKNLVIINSCAVTAEAERQTRQAIRRARRQRPGAKLIVTGCAAQINPDQFARMEEVDAIWGNDEKTRKNNYLELDQGPRIKVNDILSVRENAPQMLTAFAERARAFIEVQNGCDHRCTFCIIPYGRGNSRSIPAGAVVEQVKHLVEKGYSEIVLTGVDLTSYGSDLPGALTLGRLCRQILDHVPELPRLRLSSIDMIETDEILMEVAANEARFMPFLHLSVQSGDDLTLKRMKRRHNRQDVIDFCRLMRKNRPDMVFGADFIAGFPTETEEMFENTCRLVEEAGLTHLHVFPYSPRPGTPAANMPQVTKNIIKSRAKRLREIGEQARQQLYNERVGQEARVLIEKWEGVDPTGSPYAIGHTEDFSSIRLSGAAAINGNGAPGNILPARITGQDGTRLLGEFLSHA